MIMSCQFSLDDVVNLSCRNYNGSKECAMNGIVSSHLPDA